MYYLVYVSSAASPFTPAELADLQTRCMARNTMAGITGMLLYKDGNFMQVLEGEEEAVRRVYARIGHDPRHRGLLTLLQGSQDERQFPDWTMGFRDLDSADVRVEPGYSEFLNTPLTGAEFKANPARSQKLLLTFKRSM
jgi:hypothetical protein